MSPYQLITQNKRKTWLIMLLFVGLFTGFFYLVGKFFDSPGTYLFLGLLISTASSIGSYFFADKIVLMSLGAKPASKKNYFDFYTVTENLTIAAGLPMPKLYVIDDPAPNAFATGRDPQHAVVCATTGLLKMLDRSDIEGVVAHELSHIKNYDILLATIVSVLVGAISIIADWLMRSLWWKEHSDNEERKNPLLAILFIISLILVPIVATLIQLAISRKREFLADASAVLLTRNPHGLADALEKISHYQSSRFIPSSMSHLFIVNPLNSKNSTNWLVNLFSTHPPIEERIRILRSM
ncbi:MAG: M48 family metalloprotease [Microgenomates group bacterium]